jgi:hypothetical protein
VAVNSHFKEVVLELTVPLVRGRAMVKFDAKPLTDRRGAIELSNHRRYEKLESLKCDRP